MLRGLDEISIDDSDFSFAGADDQLDLHSFPTRRSSDLVRLVVLLPFQLLRLSLATPLRWTPAITGRSEERFSRNAETDIVCRLLLEKKKRIFKASATSREAIRLTMGPRTPMVSQVSSRPWAVAPDSRRQARQAVAPGRTVMVRP